MDWLGKLACGKPFAFTEIGYSADPSNNSTEDAQATFVDTMFSVLQPYRDEGQISFILYHALYDYPPSACAPFDAYPTICSFLESLGLRKYTTGAPRKAWDSFVRGVDAWTK